MLSLFWIKNICAICLFISTLIGCGVPVAFINILLRYKPRIDLIISYLQCFGAGLLLSTGFEHVLMNAIDAFDAYREDLAYPYVGSITALSFITACFIDRFFMGKQQTTTVFRSTVVVNEEVKNPVEPQAYCLALIFHSFFEGLVIGAVDIPITKAGIYTIFVVLMFYKFLEGFVLGTLFQSHDYRNIAIFLWSLLFSLICPCGILAGVFLHKYIPSYTSLIAGICSSISAGVFIQVGGQSILSRETYLAYKVRYKFIPVIIGFGLSTLVAWFA